MNTFKVTYTDGTSYITDANGTAAEFKAYLCQDGGRIVSENPVTGEETTRWIATVEEIKEQASPSLALGPQEPPSHPWIYNKRRPDGTYPPLSGFFDRNTKESKS